jgi:hypothetical protein
MTDDTVLEEAMDNLKEAGQRIRATQSLMRSQGMTDGENRSGIPRGPAPEGSPAGRRAFRRRPGGGSW